MDIIRYGQQDINQSDIDAVVEVLKSINLTQGPNIDAFENEINRITNSKFGVAVNSATSALHIACKALGVGHGDYVWTTPNTFVASANCALYCDAKVDFVDIDSETYNMCERKLSEKLSKAKQNNCLPKVVIPVHFAGQSCNMEEIYRLSIEYNFKIIEDASHAIGGNYKNEPIGNCQYSDITVFSFHPVKIITTAEGGIAVTNDKGLATKMSLYRSHGITRDPDLMTEEMHGSWYYQQVDLGYNFRMTDLQAALGLSQLKRLKSFVSKRHEIAQRYDTLFVGMPIKTPKQMSYSYSAYHLYVIRLDLDNIATSHKEVFEYLRSKNIMVNLHYIPVHTQPYYQAFGFKSGDFPESEQYYKEAISIPLHPLLTHAEQDFVVKTIQEIIQ